MSAKPVKPEEKVFHLTEEQKAELSYISMNRTSAMEVANFWDKRMDRFMGGVRLSLSIGEDHNVMWDEAFSKGIIKAQKVPKVEKAPEPKPEPKEEHGSDKKGM